MLLTGPQAGSDALQSKWAVGPWSDSTLAVLVTEGSGCSWVGSTATELLARGLKLRKDLRAFLVAQEVFLCTH